MVPLEASFYDLLWHYSFPNWIWLLAFIGHSSCDALRLQKIQSRCRSINGILILKIFPHWPAFLMRCLIWTLLIILILLPFLSGRFSVSFCRKSLRRSSFIPFMWMGAHSLQPERLILINFLFHCTYKLLSFLAFSDWVVVLFMVFFHLFYLFDFWFLYFLYIGINFGFHFFQILL